MQTIDEIAPIPIPANVLIIMHAAMLLITANSMQNTNDSNPASIYISFLPIISARNAGRIDLKIK